MGLAMPLFTVIALSSFALGIVDVFRGAPFYGGASLAVWYLGGITPLGIGVDWDARLRYGAAFLGMIVAALLAVMGVR